MYGGFREMMNSQQFLETYANTPVEVIDVEDARIKLQKLGILTKSNKISSKYSGIIVKSKSGHTVAKDKSDSKKAR